MHRRYNFEVKVSETRFIGIRREKACEKEALEERGEEHEGDTTFGS